MQLDSFLHAVYQHREQLTEEAYFLPTEAELRTMAMDTGITEEEYEKMLNQSKTEFENGKSYFNSKTYIEALKCFEEAMRYRPYSIEIWNWRCKSLAILSQIQSTPYLDQYTKIVSELQLIAKQNPAWGQLAAQHTASKHTQVRLDIQRSNLKKRTIYIALTVVCVIIGAWVYNTRSNNSDIETKIEQAELQVQESEQGLKDLMKQTESLSPEMQLEYKYEIEGAKNRVRIAKQKLAELQN